MKNKIKQAIKEYEDLQSRKINPDGNFDNASRWYPSDKEKQDCCNSIRTPSRKFPYSLMVHCRSLKHICNKYGLNYSEVKKQLNK